MQLTFFTEEAYEELFYNIKANEEHYLDCEDWISERYPGRNFVRKSSVVVHDFSPHISTERSDAALSEDDLINVRFLYEGFKNLTPVQASNKYMWTCLCHTEPMCRAYIINRWMANPRKETIRTRFFVDNTKDSLFNNALSRLWWYGYLTYDSENTGNPWHLTEVLLMNQTVCTDFMDTRNRTNPNRAKGVLTALKDFKEEIGEESIVDYFRDCNKYLNRYAAVTSLDSMKEKEIRDIAFNYLMSLR